MINSINYRNFSYTLILENNKKKITTIAILEVEINRTIDE